MPTFRYRGRDRTGRALQGEMDASSREALARSLQADGITPTRIEAAPARETGNEGSATGIARWLEPRVQLGDLAVFSRQMYSLTRAGVPIIRALTGLAQNTRNRRLARAIRNVAEALEGGRGVADAFGAQGVFPNLFVSMLRVGENAGRLDESFLRIASSLESERETREQVKGALRYPSFVMVAIVIAIVVINIFVIPAFADLFAGMDQQLPLPTRILLTTSALFLNWWPALLALAAAGTAAFLAWLRTEAGRLRFDRWKLAIPGIGSIVRRALLARFARTLAISLRAGVPVLTALEAVAGATDNAFVAARIREMRTGVERGEGLLRAATNTELFTPLVLQMLSVGEETGRVDEMMEEVADFYEREVEADLKRLSSYIEPVVITAIGLLVLILALAIFLPMWQMGGAAL
ncbi:MSHA biogenesis protein MshG [Thiohalospira halophila DSM 15071]|uniref:MSHA biogenesis protein MshG n=1 Tax=Thiohalospira halophila DSM 15071 TaxID=1123397 RepID=A0A1I1NDL4_9GAMM|nr:type II secretion system F family protein [Thiohalospira halophila]SFC93558.1 MSHA biogenesis protein MshG [Thiohalospira halophila DSM 15071]